MLRSFLLLTIPCLLTRLYADQVGAVMQQKMVKQPIITDAEIAKTERYNRDIQARGYRPWVTVRQSHTYGQGQIVFSHKTGREHHLLSRGERLPFFCLEHDPRARS